MYTEIMKVKEVNRELGRLLHIERDYIMEIDNALPHDRDWET